MNNWDFFFTFVFYLAGLYAMKQSRRMVVVFSLGVALRIAGELFSSPVLKMACELTGLFLVLTAALFTAFYARRVS